MPSVDELWDPVVLEGATDHLMLSQEYGYCIVGVGGGRSTDLWSMATYFIRFQDETMHNGHASYSTRPSGTTS